MISVAFETTAGFTGFMLLGVVKSPINSRIHTSIHLKQAMSGDNELLLC